MKEYEVIWEIFNKCPRNQMRDVFVEEVEIEDPEEYIKKKFQGKDVSYDKTVLARWDDHLLYRNIADKTEMFLYRDLEQCGIIQVQDCRYYIAIMQHVNPYRDET